MDLIFGVVDGVLFVPVLDILYTVNYDLRFDGYKETCTTEMPGTPSVSKRFTNSRTEYLGCRVDEAVYVWSQC
jgi:hypothetical protein